MEILNSLRNGPQALSRLYGRCTSGTEIVATFVAVLELCKTGSILFKRVEEQIVLKFTGAESEIEQILDDSSQPVDELYEAACQRGGIDNVSIILAKIL